MIPAGGIPDDRFMVYDVINRYRKCLTSLTNKDKKE